MNNGKMSTRTLVQAAILVAISIVLSRVGSIMILPTVKLGFGEVPLIMSGFLFGPVVGGLSGLVADLVGFAINPQGPSLHPGFTLSTMMWGILAGLFAIYFRKTKNDKEIFTGLRVTITVVISMVIITLGLNTYWLTHLYGDAFIVLLPGRLITFLVTAPIKCYLITILMKHIRPITEANN